MSDIPPYDENLVADDFDNPVQHHADSVSFMIEVNQAEHQNDVELATMPSSRQVSARQRVEILREEQWLQALITDLENLDLFESTNDRYFEGLSH